MKKLLIFTVLAFSISQMFASEIKTEKNIKIEDAGKYDAVLTTGIGPLEDKLVANVGDYRIGLRKFHVLPLAGAIVRGQLKVPGFNLGKQIYLDSGIYNVITRSVGDNRQEQGDVQIASVKDKNIILQPKSGKTGIIF